MRLDFENFSSSLADVLFRDVPREAGPLANDDLVTRFEEWFKRAELTHLHMVAGYMDKVLIAKLSGAQQLAIARIVQAKHPRLISRMPTLCERQEHLRRSHELAQIFMPDSLSKLTAAIAKEIS